MEVGYQWWILGHNKKHTEDSNQRVAANYIQDPIRNSNFAISQTVYLSIPNKDIKDLIIISSNLVLKYKEEENNQ